MKNGQLRKCDKKRKMDKQTLDERNCIFNNVQMCSMVDPCIHITPGFRLTEEDLKSAIQKGRSYCDIVIFVENSNFQGMLLS